jgi:UPF0755 protein
MKKFKLIALYVALFVILTLLALAAAFWYWATNPVRLSGAQIDYVVEQGSRPRAIARLMNQSGVKINEDGFVLLARLSGLDRKIKAGAYEAAQGDTPQKLLERMANGEMTQTQITLVEGWTYQRIRQALREDPLLKQTLNGVSDEAILKRLGSVYNNPEGLFYPDTYVFAPGSTDYDILRRAHHAEVQLLDAVWAERDPGLPFQTPYQALTLASIIEKETGDKSDRERVAGVFVNRLRINMPLQTDPTVIYGMKDAYQGQIRKIDLMTDTPWNTYTRPGLPPTPIASPGKASLLAALHPETNKYLYFVSRGDGASEFSETLADHNKAVAKYILKAGR